MSRARVSQSLRGDLTITHSVVGTHTRSMGTARLVQPIVNREPFTCPRCAKEWKRNTTVLRYVSDVGYVCEDCVTSLLSE